MYVPKLGRSKQLNQIQNSCVVKLQHKTSELQILCEEINRLWLSFYASEMYKVNIKCFDISREKFGNSRLYSRLQHVNLPLTHCYTL